MGKIITKEFEYSESYDKEVKPICRSAHIPFFRRFLGRIVKVLIPEPEKGFWLFSEKEKKQFINLIETEITLVKPGWYSQARKDEIREALRDIRKSEFEIENLAYLVDLLDEKNLIVKKIRKLYQI